MTRSIAHVILSTFYVSILFFSQSCVKEKESIPSNSTSHILEEGLRTAFADTLSISIESLTSSIEYVNEEAHVKSTDSILVILHGIDEKLLPKIDSLNFKVITEKQACGLISKDRSIKVLEVEILAFDDNSAKLKVQQSCVTWINNDCRFNFMCGTGLGIELIKQNNEWVGEIKSSWAG
ncbi:hypothetical protein GCM10023183_16300 [Nibribacter koreensis]|uniref:Lipoprotein n=2 Tax=Nibribacter koreensis TaxID=1084519 RepID=A0ABP8FHL1_9BACT